MIEYADRYHNEQVQFNYPKIKVLGIGGGGNNAVSQMIKNHVRHVEFYFLNTEIGILNRANTNNILQIGRETTKGLGAGANPSVGERAAIESKEEIKNILQDTDLLFLTAGMGGGTGTGAIPVVAEIAKEMKITTIAIVTSPFLFEGKQRALRAREGIRKLKENVNSLIIISNDQLLKITHSRVTMQDAFKLADDVIEQGVKGITGIITSIGNVNVDFADIITILQYKGMAYMAIGRAIGEHRMEEAVKQAINNPLTENSIKNAKGIIFNVRGNSELELNELNDGMTIINEQINEDANIIFGTTVDESLGDEIIVTVIATGVEEKTNE